MSTRNINTLFDDPTGVAPIQLPVDAVLGTNAQRLAYPTGQLPISKYWYETDTGNTYQWSGAVWNLFSEAGQIGGGGQVVTGPVIAVSTNIAFSRNLVL